MPKVLDPDYVRSRLAYDPVTGTFTWKAREVRRASDRSWNTKWAGKKAGVADDRGYVLIGIDNQRYYGHRLAWVIEHGEWPGDEIDHKDRSCGTNAFSNLRPADRSQNVANTGLSSRNKSGAKGVSWCKRDKRWQAHIAYRGKRIFLGRFDTVAEASEAYAAAARRYFGAFAAPVMREDRPHV